MSWWTSIRDAAEAVFTPTMESDSGRNQKSGVTATVNKGYSAVGGAVNAVTGRTSAADKRTQQYAINDQIKAYKDQTALTEQQIKQAQESKDVLKRQVQEKQIRALRGNYRPVGGYGTGTTSSLGNSGTQTNKLGTA